jgi:hypothetical protein
MKKTILLNTLAIVFILFFAFRVDAQNGIQYPSDKKVPWVNIYSSGKVEKFYIKAQELKKAGAHPTATFEVTYNGFSDEAKEAFGKAVELWSYLIYSTVPIKINALWEPLGPGILGSCGPETFYRDFKNTPKSRTWYPIALANKIAGYDLNPDLDDISARFSSVFSWYLGTDGNCPYNQYDFVSIVMHELAHGLGFIGSANVDGTSGEWGNGSKIPMVYDKFVYNGNNQLVMDTFLFANPSTQLKTQYTSNNLFFKSNLSDAANGNAPSKLYVPPVWNDGSSYSHLDEVFNGTSNSLMTYSSGYAEVVHHPGNITLGMFAEMGWINILYKHTKLKDIESMPAPVTVETEIYSDSSLIAGSVILHYSTNNFVTNNQVVMSTTNDTVYSGQIPSTASGKIKYYFEAKNTLNRTYYYPVQKTSSIDSTFSFTIGTDNTKPIISHESESYILANVQDYELEMSVFDNLGIDSVFVEYKINSNPSKTIKCTSSGNNNSSDYLIYNVVLPLGDVVLSDGDILKYKIVAVDKATISNTTSLPTTGWFETKIYDFLEATQDFSINFNNAEDENKFILDGLTITQPSGFSSKGLHSPHPYEEGDSYPTDELSYSAILKVPIILKNQDSYIRFDEIVIVEPGSTGSSYGDSNFWDYVVLEGSKDNGATWKDIANGYDCSINTTFKNAFNNSLNGTESMYKSHMIDLIGKNYFNGQDTILIRFRLWSDQLTAGWGWAIDNIEIQGTVSSSKDLILNNSKMFIYPNPSTGRFSITIKSENKLENLAISVINIDGSLLYSKNLASVEQNEKIDIDISHIPAGVYFIKLQTPTEFITQKLIIN